LQVPTVLFVSRFDLEVNHEDWWERNREHFDDSGISVEAAVMGCTADVSKYPETVAKLYEERRKLTREQMMAAIEENALVVPWVIGWGQWFLAVICDVLKTTRNFFSEVWSKLKLTADEITKEIKAILDIN